MRWICFFLWVLRLTIYEYFCIHVKLFMNISVFMWNYLWIFMYSCEISHVYLCIHGIRLKNQASWWFCLHMLMRTCIYSHMDVYIIISVQVYPSALRNLFGGHGQAFSIYSFILSTIFHLTQSYCIRLVFTFFCIRLPLNTAGLRGLRGLRGVTVAGAPLRRYGATGPVVVFVLRGARTCFATEAH